MAFVLVDFANAMLLGKEQNAARSISCLQKRAVVIGTLVTA
jgi:hypothetical protein